MVSETGSLAGLFVFCRSEMFSMEREGRFMPPQVELSRKTAFSWKIWILMERTACFLQRIGRERGRNFLSAYADMHAEKSDIDGERGVRREEKRKVGVFWTDT